MNTPASQELPLQMPDQPRRYWRIDRVHGKGKHQTHRYLCTVTSISQTHPVRLARACGFGGPFHCVEMSFEEYAANLQRAFH